MRQRDISLARDLERRLREFSESENLAGLRPPGASDAFLEQLIESMRRVRYVTTLDARPISVGRLDPNNGIFDPIKAACLYKLQGNIDEAFWLVFLAIHFGKNRRYAWSLVKAVYKGEGSGGIWTWRRVSSDVQSFRDWLYRNEGRLRSVGAFGNHRKYESLKARGKTGTGHVIQTYVQWVGSSRSHLKMIKAAAETCGGNPRTLFSSLYNSMDAVARFGRTARFDFLCMLGKLSLVRIEPESTYMIGATGPLTGARLLFDGNKNSRSSPRLLDGKLVGLEHALSLDFGMQVLEDALCNWQKSPRKFVRFRG